MLSESTGLPPDLINLIIAAVSAVIGWLLKKLHVRNGNEK